MNNRLKVFIGGEFDGFTSFGIDYLKDNFERMTTGEVNVKGEGKNYGRIINGKSIEGGYIFNTNKNIEIKYVEE
nr:hypothetical protein [Clostridioides sp.]